MRRWRSRGKYAPRVGYVTGGPLGKRQEAEDFLAEFSQLAIKQQ